MKITASDLSKDLKALAVPERKAASMRFFKTKKGQYGAGDLFIGVTVPEQRKVSKAYKDMDHSELKKLMTSKIHEERLCALFILISQYKNAPQKVADFYIAHRDYVNNWDLVDASAHKILGPHLLNEDKTMLFDWAKSGHLWERRIAVIATLHFIKMRVFEPTLKISEILLNDEHDLIHKAVGWMLRELGKLDQSVEEEFLKKHYKRMPRTMLRYAVERFDEPLRKAYLKGEI